MNDPARELTVLTLNLWNRAPPWEERLAVIRAGLAARAPDVVSLQEVISLPDVGFDQAAQIADGLGYEVAFAQSPTGEFILGNAVLSRFPIVERDVLILPQGGHDEGRCALFTRLQTPWGPLPFVATHLHWKLHHGHIRYAQVQALVDHLAGFVRAGDLPPVIAGDFNAEPDSDEIRFLRGYTGGRGPCVHFNDCWRAAGDGTAGYTFARRNPNAALSREPDRRIDYVFVGGPDEALRGVPLSCALCFEEPVDGVYASDHYGVVARIDV